MNLRFIAILFLGLILCPLKSSACSYGESFTDSVEPVTIKMGHTFLQIPESAFRHMHTRAPAEKKYVRLYLRFSEIDIVEVSLSAEHEKKVDFTHMPLNDEVSIWIISASQGVRDDSLIKDKIFPYFLPMISESEPATWKRDLYLSKKFDAGGSPCEGRGIGAILGILFGIGDADEIIEGLKHRNSAIRNAAALFANEREISNTEIRALMEDLAKNDKDESVRLQASSIIERR